MHAGLMYFFLQFFTVSDSLLTLAAQLETQLGMTFNSMLFILINGKINGSPGSPELPSASGAALLQQLFQHLIFASSSLLLVLVFFSSSNESNCQPTFEQPV